MSSNYFSLSTEKQQTRVKYHSRQRQLTRTFIILYGIYLLLFPPLTGCQRSNFFRRLKKQYHTIKPGPGTIPLCCHLLGNIVNRSLSAEIGISQKQATNIATVTNQNILLNRISPSSLLIMCFYFCLNFQQYN